MEYREQLEPMAPLAPLVPEETMVAPGTLDLMEQMVVLELQVRKETQVLRDHVAIGDIQVHLVPPDSKDSQETMERME